MTPSNMHIPKEITDDDIRWAARILGFRQDAFHGPDGSDPRRDVLRCLHTIDVAACPGSGKTTLLVAKLAILGEKWTQRTRGVCVLSHTNVARREIETRLGNTSGGRALLSYPHFVGTIHAFVNEFLAVPWLRSLGYPIKMVDSGICAARRWAKIPKNSQYALTQKRIEPSSMCIADTNFTPAKKSGGFPFGAHTATYKCVQIALREIASEGFHCHEDMFVWGNALLDTHANTTDAIRNRFPLLFIDEAQDNSEEQSAILHRIFMAGKAPVIRQRFGDANQAVFNFVGQTGAVTDQFPDENVKRDLPNSHRFGQQIAEIANPLGLCPCGLAGHGPKRPIASGAAAAPHTVFLFDDAKIGSVLDAYANLLLETLSDQELCEGSFTAVGQVHKDTGDDNIPRHVGHYWPAYDPELSNADPVPRTFVQCIFAGQSNANVASEAFPAVEKIAQGLLHLSATVQGSTNQRARRYSHRYVMQLIESSTSAKGWYKVLLSRFALRRKALTWRAWNDRWREVVRMIGEAMVGVSLSNNDANRYLEWPEDPNMAVTTATIPSNRNNVYCYSNSGRQVDIRIGSIHSVKGETHTATLVLETFWHDHNLESIKYWLLGDQSGAGTNGVRTHNRLKLHYVAMTRPTHLLCLAMKRSTFIKNGGALDDEALAKLTKRGWTTKQL